jgi:hypothetical protein
MDRCPGRPLRGYAPEALLGGGGPGDGGEVLGDPPLKSTPRALDWRKLQTALKDIHLPKPVIRTHYGNGFLKQHVRDHLCLRTELATNDATDYGLKKAVEKLPQLADRLDRLYQKIVGDLDQLLDAVDLKAA